MHGEDSHYVAYTMGFLFVSGMCWVLYSMNMSKKGMKQFVQGMGVKIKRVARATKEIERKTFHLTGLTVPVTYALALDYWNFTQLQFTYFAIAVTSVTWMIDLARLFVPGVRENMPLSRLFRAHEENQLCGACFFSLGCTLAIALFPPAISMCSIAYLVFGDMSAALIGVSFGGEIAVIKLGRAGKKSAEGSIAMFVVCSIIGIIFFRAAPVSEYIAAFGATVATLVELYEPFGLDDNLTIPVCSSLALTYAFHRVGEACGASL